MFKAPRANLHTQSSDLLKRKIFFLIGSNLSHSPVVWKLSCCFRLIDPLTSFTVLKPVPKFSCKDVFKFQISLPVNCLPAKLTPFPAMIFPQPHPLSFLGFQTLLGASGHQFNSPTQGKLRYGLPSHDLILERTQRPHRREQIRIKDLLCAQY